MNDDNPVVLLLVFEALYLLGAYCINKLDQHKMENRVIKNVAKRAFCDSMNKMLGLSHDKWRSPK